MNPGNTRMSEIWMCRVLPRFVLLGVAALGWRLARWTGLFIGFCVGCLLAILTWGIVYYLFAKARHNKISRELSKLSDEQLKEIATNPSSRNLAFAMAELERRGITGIRPTIESVFESLTSNDANARAMGLSCMIALYPGTLESLSDGASSGDGPEVWRERIAAFNLANNSTDFS